MHGKIGIFLLILAGALFAGQYTSYCFTQISPCAQANCYKVNGNWTYNPDVGREDCMYDNTTVTDSQVADAFSSCLSQEALCEQSMEANQSASSSSESTSPVDQCCGAIVMILGTVGITAYASLKK